MTVTTTIYPLYSIAKEVGADKIKLQNLIPFGVEAHGFDPAPADMAKLSKVIYLSQVVMLWNHGKIR